MSEDDRALVWPTKVEHIIDNTDRLCDSCKHLYSSNFRSSIVEWGDSIHADPICPMCGFFKYCLKPQDVLLDYSVPETYRISLCKPPGRGFDIDTWYTQEHRQDADVSQWGPGTSFLATEPSLEERTRLIEAMTIDFSLVKGWLQSCRENHHSDGSESHTGQPKDFRLIHCEKRQLVEAPPSCEYVALSYVWGQTQHSLRQGSRPELPYDLPTSLPATIQDAITVTLNLGFDFLWVDQFCIDQSNPQKLHDQLNDMCLIYRSAVLTIVAAAGDDANFGLPGVSIPRNPQLRLTVRGVTYAATYGGISSEVECTKWHTRAWVYQEGVFSLRRLVFTTWQVSLVCHESVWAETTDAKEILRFGRCNGSNASFRPLQVSPGSSSNRCRLFLLFEHISEYTRRKLTYDFDAINGMRGIFDHFKLSSGISHHWGIPVITKEGFTEALGWTCSNFSMVRRPDFPSWSWAGWKTEVSFEENKIVDPHPEFRVSFQRMSDGKFTEPAETFRSKVTSQLDLSPPFYSMSIRIEAIMYKIPPYSFDFYPDSFQITIRDSRSKFNGRHLLSDFDRFALSSSQQVAIRNGDTYAVQTEELGGLIVWSYQGRAERLVYAPCLSWFEGYLSGELRTIVLS